MKPHIAECGPVPNVSKRQIATLDTLADRFVADRGIDEDYLPLFRLFARVIARDMEWSFRRAIDSALSQATGLMEDPERYNRQSRRKKAQREAAKREREEMLAQHREAMNARNEELRKLADEGRLKPMRGYKLNIPRRKETEVEGD